MNAQAESLVLVSDERHRGNRFVSSFTKFCRAKPLGAVGMVIILGLCLLAAAAPFVAQHSPLTNDTLAQLTKPSAAHWFGTDQYGRDVFSRVLYGGRTS